MEIVQQLIDSWTSSGLAFKSAIVGSALFILWLIRDIYIWRFQLRTIPGPFTNSFSCYYVLINEGLNGRLHIWKNREFPKYGRMVRTGPSHVLTTDPEIAKKVSALRSPYFKAPYYTIVGRMAPGADNTFSLGGRANKEKHYQQRTLLAPTYNGRENAPPPFEEVIDAEVANLVGLLGKYVPKHPGEFLPCNFGVIGQYYALDVISSLIWSESFGFLQKDTDVGNYIQTLEDLLPIRGATGSLPILPWLTPLIEATLPSPEDKQGFGMLQGVGKRVAEERLRQIEAGQVDIKRDMLTSFIEKGLRGKDLYGEMFITVAAGSDSPATIIRIAMALLVMTPIAYQKLNHEISTAIASGKASSPIRDVEARALPYLQAVIRETVRLYPTVAEFYKEVPPEGDVVDGHHLPGGTWFGYALVPMMRNKDQFGQDADVFRPERWIEMAEEKDGERFKSMVSVVDLAFGSGKFVCLGKLVGWVAMEKAIFEMLRHFDFACVNPEQPIKILGYGLYVVQDEVFRVTRKETSLAKEVA